MRNSNFKIVLSPPFLICLFLLLANDFFLKSYFHNFLTGKISDFAGLFIFPIFFSAFSPHRKNLIYASTAIAFIFWKSPLSQSFIEWWNEHLFFHISRTIDLTDLTALAVLPASYFYFLTHQPKTASPKTISLNLTKQTAAIFVVCISVFAFTATSSVDEQHILLDEKYMVKLSKSEIENVLRQNGKIFNLKIERETETFPANQYPDIKRDPNGFYAGFSLNQKICDTASPGVSFHIQEKKSFSETSDSPTTFPDSVREPESNNFTEVSRVSFDFTCQSFPKNTANQTHNINAAQKQYRSELAAIFEHEVIDKLKEKESQSSK